MKKLKHVKSPWNSFPMRGTAGHCVLAQVFDGDGLSVCDVDSRFGENGATEVAKLIAAAPDLLEALEKVVQHAKDFGLSYEVYDIAELAIKKATE